MPSIICIVTDTWATAPVFIQPSTSCGDTPIPDANSAASIVTVCIMVSPGFGVILVGLKLAVWPSMVICLSMTRYLVPDPPREMICHSICSNAPFLSRFTVPLFPSPDASAGRTGNNVSTKIPSSMIANRFIMSLLS